MATESPQALSSSDTNPLFLEYKTVHETWLRYINEECPDMNGNMNGNMTDKDIQTHMENIGDSYTIYVNWISDHAPLRESHGNIIANDEKQARIACSVHFALGMGILKWRRADLSREQWVLHPEARSRRLKLNRLIYHLVGQQLQHGLAKGQYLSQMKRKENLESLANITGFQEEYDLANKHFEHLRRSLNEDPTEDPKAKYHYDQISFCLLPDGVDMVAEALMKNSVESGKKSALTPGVKNPLRIIEQLFKKKS